MKVELKHLAGYLPYNLKVLSGFGEYSEIDSLYFSKDEHKRPSLNLMVSHFPKGFRGENFVDIKPILRPLSDLTKEEFYHLWSHETDFESIIKFTESDIETIESYKFSLSFWNGIHENHFDIYGLIENNLAIDINTL